MLLFKNIISKIFYPKFLNMLKRYYLFIYFSSNALTIFGTYINIPDRKIYNYKINNPVLFLTLDKENAFCKAAHLDELGNQKDNTGYVRINLSIPFYLKQLRKRTYIFTKVILGKAFTFEDFGYPLFENLMSLNNEQVTLPSYLGSRFILGNLYFGLTGKFVDFKHFTNLNLSLNIGVLFFYHFEFINNFKYHGSDNQKKITNQGYEQLQNIQIPVGFLTDIFSINVVTCLNRERTVLDQKETVSNTFKVSPIFNFISELFMPYFNFISLKLNYFLYPFCDGNLYSQNITFENIKYFSDNFNLSEYIIKNNLIAGLSLKILFIEINILKNIYMGAFNKALNNNNYVIFSNLNNWTDISLYSLTFSLKTQFNDNSLLPEFFRQPISSLYSFKDRIYNDVRPIILTSGNKIF